MLRYLRIQAATHSHNYAQQMHTHGSYMFAPQSDPSENAPIQAPANIHEIMEHEELYVSDSNDDSA